MQNLDKTRPKSKKRIRLTQSCRFLCSSTGNRGPGGLPGELPELSQNQIQSESEKQQNKKEV